MPFVMRFGRLRRNRREASQPARPGEDSRAQCEYRNTSSLCQLTKDTPVLQPVHRSAYGTSIAARADRVVQCCR
jgi:hypothetical protein